MDYVMDQIIAEMRYTHEKLLAFADAVDAKLSLLIEGEAVVIALFAGIGIVQDSPLVYWIVLGFISVAYVFGVVFVCVCWAPWRYPFPLPADWQQLASSYMPLTENDMRDALVKQYIHVIVTVQSVLDQKAKGVTIGLVAIAISLVALVMLQMVLGLLGE